jgi:hypothetical protein
MVYQLMVYQVVAYQVMVYQVSIEIECRLYEIRIYQLGCSISVVVSAEYCMPTGLSPNQIKVTVFMGCFPKGVTPSRYVTDVTKAKVKKNTHSHTYY